MYQEISKLILYRNFGRNNILQRISDCIREIGGPKTDPSDGDLTPEQKSGLQSRIYEAVHDLLDLATAYGFDHDLWRDYLAFLLITNENSLSLTAEKKGIEDGSVRQFALQDMKVFARLFVFDFGPAEQAMGIDCFKTITDYQAIEKRAQNYNRNVSLRVRETSDAISRVLEDCGITVGNPGGDMDQAASRMLEILSDFYRDYGVGMFGLNKAFRIREYEGSDTAEIGFRGSAEGRSITFLPINNMDHVMLDDLIGYEIQKKKLRDNTEAFLAGHRANNCLLYGDAGTGKSTSIKALINEYYDRGLRMIEIYKHQFQWLSSVISEVKHRNYKFIIYMDDLSFEDFEIEYKYLKAVIEGGLESRPDNVLIYATSNRRHLIRETWNDTSDVDLEKHRGDTLQEKLSLVDRFGISIPYMKPGKKDFMEIVRRLAERNPHISMDESLLEQEAQKWEMSHGGFSGRVAQQFVDDLAGRSTK